jgi:BirA family transcriptional regulator, biotin operon repressor / biotin---[acetyl-CoA-carboxylase] ligase
MSNAVLSIVHKLPHLTTSTLYPFNKSTKLRYLPPIDTQFIGQHIIYEAVCASTNSFSVQCMAEKDLPEGTVVITDHQHRGRGQGDRVWHSEPYKNLTFSVILYPTFLAAQQIFSLNIITTVAIKRVLSLYIPNRLYIKWPNDIYYQEKKLGGILIENVIQKNKLKASVIGIGLNVNQTNFSFQTPTSLSLICQRNNSLQGLLAQLLVGLERNYLRLQAQDMTLLKSKYLKNMYWIHEVRTFRDAHHTFQGTIKGVDTAGKLVIEQADGILKCYHQQEVVFVG